MATITEQFTKGSSVGTSEDNLTVVVTYPNGVTQSPSSSGLNPNKGAITTLASSVNSSQTISYPGAF
jgi:hypothetical protein